jgi:diamine N-acetyltransferase
VYIFYEQKQEVARAFAIYIESKIVGFTMFAFDEENEDPCDKHWLWRFMIDESLQGKGYGSLALAEIIKYFKENGQMNDEEIVLKLYL